MYPCTERFSMKFVFIISVLLILFPASSIDARVELFDDQRSGFLFSMGTGGGLTKVSAENLGVKGDRTKGTVGYFYKLGYAPSDQLQIYGFQISSVYAYKLWEHFEDFVDHSKTDASYALAPVVLPLIGMFTDQHYAFGLGASYFVRPGVPSWYVTLGAGGSLAADPDEEDSPSFFPGWHGGGLALMGGVGYEFTRHGTIEVNIFWGHESWDTAGGKKEWDALSVIVTVGLMAY